VDRRPVFADRADAGWVPADTLDDRGDIRMRVAIVRGVAVAAGGVACRGAVVARAPQ
jgi:hypothetical protein